MKGPRAPRNPPVPTPSDELPTSPEKRCWQIVPTDLNEFLPEFESGEPLTGSVVNNRVLISSQAGFVGYAPDRESSEIIEYVKNSNFRLAGQVIFASQDGDMIVELCAI